MPLTGNLPGTLVYFQCLTKLYSTVISAALRTFRMTKENAFPIPQSLQTRRSTISCGGRSKNSLPHHHRSHLKPSFTSQTFPATSPEQSGKDRLWSRKSSCAPKQPPGTPKRAADAARATTPRRQSSGIPQDAAKYGSPPPTPFAGGPARRAPQRCPAVGCERLPAASSSQTRPEEEQNGRVAGPGPASARTSRRHGTERRFHRTGCIRCAALRVNRCFYRCSSVVRLRPGVTVPATPVLLP